MTVSYKAGSVNSTSANANQVTVVIPASASVGDLAIIWCAEQAAGPTFTADQGFVADLNNGGGTNICIGTLKKTLVAGDAGKTVTITSSSSTHKLTAGIVVVSGGTVVDVTSATGTGSSLAVAAATVTPTVAHDFVLTLHAIASANTRNWTGWTLGGTAASAGPFGGNGSGGSGGVETAAFYVNDYNSTSATGPLTATATQSGNNWAAIAYTIKNAGGASGTFPVKVNKGSGWVVKPVKVNLGAGWVTKVVRNQGGAPPPNQNKILFGSSYQGNSVSGWTTQDAAIASAAGLTGRVLLLRRCYDGDIKTDFGNTAASANPGLNIHSHLSVKSGTATDMMNGLNDAALISLVTSCPANWTTYLTWQHEPEQMAPATFRAGFARFAKIVVANRGSLPVIPTWVIQSETGRSEGGRLYSDWDPVVELGQNSVASGHTTYGPLSLAEVVMGQDGYSLTNGGAGKSPTAIFDEGFTAAAANGYTRFGIGETAADNSGQFYTIAIARTWTTQMVSYAQALTGMEYVEWFSSGVGQNAPTAGWFLTDNTCRATWGNAARSQGQ